MFYLYRILDFAKKILSQKNNAKYINAYEFYDIYNTYPKMVQFVFPLLLLLQLALFASRYFW